MMVRGVTGRLSCLPGASAEAPTGGALCPISSLVLMMSSMRLTSPDVHLLWLMALTLSREGAALPVTAADSSHATWKADTAIHDRCFGWACKYIRTQLVITFVFVLELLRNKK